MRRQTWPWLLLLVSHGRAKTLYEHLDLPSNAGARQIDMAFRRKTHIQELPSLGSLGSLDDKGPEPEGDWADSGCEPLDVQCFVNAAEAHEVLSNQAKRKHYDLQLFERKKHKDEIDEFIMRHEATEVWWPDHLMSSQRNERILRDAIKRQQQRQQLTPEELKAEEGRLAYDESVISISMVCNDGTRKVVGGVDEMRDTMQNTVKKGIACDISNNGGGGRGKDGGDFQRKLCPLDNLGCKYVEDNVQRADREGAEPKECVGWAESGFCDKRSEYSEYMHINCKKHCVGAPALPASVLNGVVESTQPQQWVEVQISKLWQQIMAAVQAVWDK
jgi:hypothetical protein